MTLVEIWKYANKSFLQNVKMLIMETQPISMLNKIFAHFDKSFSQFLTMDNKFLMFWFHQSSNEIHKKGSKI